VQLIALIMPDVVQESFIDILPSECNDEFAMYFTAILKVTSPSLELPIY
jgi:hypothetical protein